MLWLHTQSHSTVLSNLSGGISTRGEQSAYRASNLYFPICLMPTSLMPGPSPISGQGRARCPVLSSNLHFPSQPPNEAREKRSPERDDCRYKLTNYIK